jgi:hypothetical protein
LPAIANPLCISSRAVRRGTTVLNKRTILGSLFLCFALTPFAAAQTQFMIRVTQGQTGSTIENNGTISIAAEVPRATTVANVNITNRGTTTVVFNRAVFTGSTDFAFVGLPDEALASIPVGQTLSFAARYTPTSSARTTGTLQLPYTAGREAGTLTINFVGTSPEYASSFTPRDGNATPVTPGGTITFPLTPVDATSSSTVVITNRGTAPGTFRSAAVTGAAFELTGLPLPDATIPAGGELRFQVLFTPKQLQQSTGTLVVELAGIRSEYNLLGNASAPVFQTEIVQPNPRILPAGALITVPDTPVGERSDMVLRVKNNGNTDGQITAIAVQGTGFSLADLPFLPLTLTPGASAAFRLTFNPAEAGRITGRLRVGQDSFELLGTALGVTLTYNYVVGETTTSVANNGNVVFTPTAVGRSSDAEFRISNTGTQAATINSIAIAGPNIFTLLNVPSFPAQLAPGASLPVQVRFAPTALGAATATLRVDNSTFTLTGSGTNPAALPEYRIEGPSGTQEPRQQPAVGLTLASPYSLPITGTLGLSFNSEVFADDPAVQFAAGGRTASFTIPAGQTRAVFADGSNQVRLQTGTVAGTLTLTPNFVTEGGVSLTPQNPPALRLSVAQAAPRVLSVSILSRTANGFTVLITGYSTSRSVQRVNLAFTARSGERLENSSLQVNVESSFLGWFQSTQSVPFGGLFSLSIPLNFTGEVVGENLSLTDTVTSVAVTLTNAIGTSNSVSADVR